MKCNSLQKSAFFIVMMLTFYIANPSEMRARTLATSIEREDIQVSGVVIDSQGLPIPGVSVIIQGTTTGVATDLDGRYSLSVPGPESILVFSFIGFNSQELEIGRSTRLNSSHVKSSYAVFCLKKKKHLEPLYQAPRAWIRPSLLSISSQPTVLAYVPSSLLCVFSILLPPRFPLFPYTTLFRSYHSGNYYGCCYRFGRAIFAVCTGPGKHLGIFFHWFQFPRIGDRKKHTSELQSREKLVCRLLLEKKKTP